MSVLDQFETEEEESSQADESSGDSPSKTYPTFWENKHPVSYALCSKGGILREAPKNSSHQNISNWFDDLVQQIMPLFGEFDEEHNLEDGLFPVKRVPDLLGALSEAIAEAQREGNLVPVLEFFEPSQEDIQAYLEQREE